MKNLMITLLITLSLSCQAYDNDNVIEYLQANNKACNQVIDIQQISLGNLTAYNVMCKVDNDTYIYQYAPQQVVSTFYISD